MTSKLQVQEWIEELSDSDFFTTAHYCRLRSKQLEEIHTPRNAASNAWRKLRNAQKVMAADSKGWKAASPYGHLPPEPASHTPFGAVQLDRTGQPLPPPPPVPAAATAPVTDSAAVAAAAAGAAADDARSDVLLETIRSDVVEMKAMTQRVRRHPRWRLARKREPAPLTCAAVCSWRRWRVRKRSCPPSSMSLPPRWRRSPRGWRA